MLSHFINNANLIVDGGNFNGHLLKMINSIINFLLNKIFSVFQKLRLKKNKNATKKML